MQKNKNNWGLINLFITALAITMILGSCAKVVKFKKSSALSKATGYVKIKKDENKHYSISIKLSNLVDPQELYPDKRAYIVWIETEMGGVKNIGQLQQSKNPFTNSLDGRLNTATPFKPLRLFITAENKVSLDNPGNQTVLQTRRFN